MKNFTKDEKKFIFYLPNDDLYVIIYSRKERQMNEIFNTHIQGEKKTEIVYTFFVRGKRDE